MNKDVCTCVRACVGVLVCKHLGLLRGEADHTLWKGVGEVYVCFVFVLSKAMMTTHWVVGRCSEHASEIRTKAEDIVAEAIMARACHEMCYKKESLDRMFKIEFDVVWTSWHEQIMKFVEN